MWSEKQEKKQQIINAKAELTELAAMKLLLGNNDLACEIHIAGMRRSISDNKKVLPILNNEIKEIQKFLDGKPNKWN